VIEKSDWEAASEELFAEARRTPGGPPSDEDLLAYARGAPSAAQSARVEAALASHPDLLQALREPLPHAPQPGDTDPLTAREQQEDWAKLRARLAGREQPARVPRPVAQPAPPAAAPRGISGAPSLPAALRSPRPERVVHLWQLATAAAVCAALAFGGLYWQTRTEAERLARDLGTPRALEHRILLPDGLLGGKQRPIPLPARREGLLLALSLIDQADYPEYRLDIVRGTGAAGKTVWSASGLARQSNGAVEIWLPPGFLKAGPYQLRLHGVGAAGESLLATYTVQLAD
jgi:hypothetical protein